MTRGFAQTAHCPRCGTAKPTGAERVPVVTCATCGLAFDPRPREAPQRRTELVPAPHASLVHEEESETAAELTVRDSHFTGLFLLLASAVLGYVATLGFDVGSYLALPLALVALLGCYGGLSRLVGKTIVTLDRHVIAATQRPLPRHRQRWLNGNVSTLAVVPRETLAGRYDVVATQAGNLPETIRLASFAHEAEAVELAEAIRRQRARLGAPILDDE